MNIAFLRTAVLNPTQPNKQNIQLEGRLESHASSELCRSEVMRKREETPDEEKGQRARHLQRKSLPTLLTAPVQFPLLVNCLLMVLPVRKAATVSAGEGKDLLGEIINFS